MITILLIYRIVAIYTYKVDLYCFFLLYTYSTDSLGAYNDRTITLKLPEEITVHDIDFFAVWCIQFLQNFGEVRLPEMITLGGPVIIPTLPPVPECIPVSDEKLFTTAFILTCQFTHYDKNLIR